MKADIAYWIHIYGVLSGCQHVCVFGALQEQTEPET